METTHLLFVQWQLGLAMAIFQGLLVLGLGLAWMLAAWQWLLGTDSQAGQSKAYHSWLGVFSIVFRLVFSFGLVVLTLVAINWPGLFERTGNVLGPILLGSVVVAFALKTTLFRVMLHEKGRASESAYTFSVLGVAFFYTAIVIGLVVMDVWLRTPVGASLIDGRYQVLDERAILLNDQVGWQLLMTFLGALLATVGWLLGRPRREQLSDKRHPHVGGALLNRLQQWLCFVGLVSGLLLVPLAAFAIRQWLPDGVSMFGLLLAQDLPFSISLASSIRLVFATRVFVVLLFLYLVLILCAYANTRHEPIERGYRQRLPLGLLFLGPMLWASVWLLSYLSKGDDVVVGHLSFADLVNTQASSSLWISAVFLLLATVTAFVGLWQSFFLEPDDPESASAGGIKQKDTARSKPGVVA